MDPEGRLPGVSTPSGDRIVLHVDADCFYASCERLREPTLRGEPVVVGMGYEPGESIGAVATASYEAREFGVESAMPIGEALERLPRRADVDTDRSIEPENSGYYRPVDSDFYESVSRDVREILRDCADVLRVVSIDEAYLDVTDRTDWSVAEGYARHVADRIRREVGVTVSVGVAPTMSVAKIASDQEKPAGVVVVEPEEVESFLAPLPLDRLHGVGPVTAGKLRRADLETIGDVAATDRDRLEDRFGERGGELVDRARGIDDRVVTPRGRPKSLSRESAFSEPERDWSTIRERVEALASAVADRAQSKEALYRTIGIKVVTPPYDVQTRERSLSGPVDEPELVEDVAVSLLSEFEDDSVRKVGVRVSNLEFTGTDQSSLEGFSTAASAESPSTEPSMTGSEPRINGQESSVSVHESRTTGQESSDGDAQSHATDIRQGHRELPHGQTTLEEFCCGE